MNLLKKFIRNDNGADMDFDEEMDPYVDPDVRVDIPEADPAAEMASLNSVARKEPEIRPASADNVSIKILQPKSHTEAMKIADKLKEGCIVLMDISNLTKEKAHRLVDFVAGVAYVLGGEMIKTSRTNIVVAPSGVDITGFMQDQPEPARRPEPVREAPVYGDPADIPEEYEEA